MKRSGRIFANADGIQGQRPSPFSTPSLRSHVDRENPPPRRRRGNRSGGRCFGELNFPEFNVDAVSFSGNIRRLPLTPSTPISSKCHVGLENTPTRPHHGNESERRYFWAHNLPEFDVDAVRFSSSQSNSLRMTRRSNRIFADADSAQKRPTPLSTPKSLRPYVDLENPPPRQRRSKRSEIRCFGDCGIPKLDFEADLLGGNIHQISSSLKHYVFVNEPISNKPVSSVAGIANQHCQQLVDLGFDQAYILFGQFLICRKGRGFIQWLTTTTSITVEEANAAYNCLSEWAKRFL